MEWQDNLCKALYLDRLGVNVNYSRMGNGVYDEVIDDDLILHEYGFEVAL